jgi:hypothetical protein
VSPKATVSEIECFQKRVFQQAVKLSLARISLDGLKTAVEEIGFLLAGFVVVTENRIWPAS